MTVHWVSMLVVQVSTPLRVTFPSMSAGLRASWVGVVIDMEEGGVVVDIVGGAGIALS